MSRIIAAYDLDEDHGRMWVNADLERMPEVVIVANQRIDLAQTVTYVPESQAENAKLRKLVDYMTPIAWYAASERERDLMRELGVEI